MLRALITEFSELLLFIAGSLVGLLLSVVYYRKQRIDSEGTEQRLMEALNRVEEQAVRNGIRSGSSLCILESFRRKYESEVDLIGMKNRLGALESKVRSNFRTGKEEIPEDLVLEYKALGDRWSQLVTANLKLKVLDAIGHISIDRLLAAHQSLFPAGFAWAGVIRKQPVWMIENFGTSVRVIETVVAESTIPFVKPEFIETNLRRLFEHWNGIVDGLLAKTSNARIREVAHFHHEFELVHPFLDGNGRLGRMIVEEQLTHLFQREIYFRPNRDEYFRALRLSNIGELGPLSKLLADELRKFNVSF